MSAGFFESDVDRHPFVLLAPASPRWLVLVSQGARAELEPQMVAYHEAFRALLRTCAVREPGVARVGSALGTRGEASIGVLRRGGYLVIRAAPRDGGRLRRVEIVTLAEARAAAERAMEREEGPLLLAEVVRLVDGMGDVDVVECAVQIGPRAPPP